MNTDLKKFLLEVTEYVRPPQEKTIFSLGGRGHYEEPISDLLAFFFQPNAEHGLGATFLRAFFECLEETGQAGDENQLKFDRAFRGVTADREITTADGKAIDLLVQSSEWVLVIEAKTYSPLYNPFDSYKKYAENLCVPNRRLILVVLSPAGTSPPLGWVGIKYADYCRTLRSHLSATYLDQPFSKWQVFAREFILHLENEFVRPTMTEDIASFVEMYEKQIAEVKKLESDYIGFLEQQVQLALESAVPGREFTAKRENWPRGPGIRCRSRTWQDADMVFWRHDGGFTLVVYLPKQAAPERILSGSHLAGMKREDEAKWDRWTTITAFRLREDALARLRLLAQYVDSVAIRHAQQT